MNQAELRAWPTIQVSFLPPCCLCMLSDMLAGLPFSVLNYLSFSCTAACMVNSPNRLEATLATLYPHTHVVLQTDKAAKHLHFGLYKTLQVFGSTCD